MRATHPVCYKVSDDEWCCEMQDRKTGRTWSTGYGSDRVSAIRDARENQPKEAFIKRSIGWVRRHPILAGAIVTGYMMFRRPIKQLADSAFNFVSQGLYALGVSQKVCTAINKAAHKLLP